MSTINPTLDMLVLSWEETAPIGNALPNAVLTRLNPATGHQALRCYLVGSMRTGVTLRNFRLICIGLVFVSSYGKGSPRSSRLAAVRCVFTARGFHFAESGSDTIVHGHSSELTRQRNLRLGRYN